MPSGPRPRPPCFPPPPPPAPPRPPSPPQLTHFWATIGKAAIRNKKLSVQMSLSPDAEEALGATMGTAPGLSPGRPHGANASYASSTTSPSGGGIGGRYGAGNGVRGDVGRGGGGGGGAGGGGLDEESRVLANKYEDVSCGVNRVPCCYGQGKVRWW